MDRYNITLELEVKRGYDVEKIVNRSVKSLNQDIKYAGKFKYSNTRKLPETKIENQLTVADLRKALLYDGKDTDRVWLLVAGYNPAIMTGWRAMSKYKDFEILGER